MPNQEKQQLSRDVAVKYGIEPYFVMPARLTRTEFWLHEDSARCFDLFAGKLDLETTGLTVIARYRTKHGIGYTERNKSDFKDDAECLRIAGLEALLAKGE